MFDFSEAQSGMDVFLGTVDYNRGLRCNSYYQEALKHFVPKSKPVCFHEVDEQALKTKGSNAPTANLTPVEKLFLVYQDVRNNAASMSKSECLTALRTLANAYPSDMELMFMMAHILLRADHYGEAMHYFERTVHLAPNHLSTWCKMTILAAVVNDHGRVMRCARRVLELGEQSRTIYSRAYVFSMALLGMGSKTSYYSSFELFDNIRFNAIKDRAQLPTIAYHYQPAALSDAPIVMFACDSAYFEKHGRGLIKSLSGIRDKIIIHAHLVNASGADLNWLKSYINRYNSQVIVTTEQQSEKHLTNPGYYTAMRFIQAPNFMKKFNRPYLIVDADSLLNNSATLLSFLGQADSPTFCMSEENPIWDRVSAPFVYFPATDAGLAVAHEAQNYLLRMFFTPSGTRAWYIDQLALFAACLKNIEDVTFVPSVKVSCIACNENAIFWTLSNDKDIEPYHRLAQKLDQQYPDP